MVKLRKNFNWFEVILVIILFSLLSSELTIYFYSKKVINSDDSSLKDITDTYKQITDKYYQGVNKSDLADAAVDGMMQYLNEKYSTYINSDESNMLNEKLDGNYKGIGIVISTAKNSYMKIINVFSNSPAEKVGVEVGDKIIKIDDIDIDENVEFSKITELISSKDSIHLVVLRDNNKKEFDIDTKVIDNPVVTTKVFENKDSLYGYIYLSSFTSSAGSQFKNSLLEIEKNNLKGLIIDLRGNSGGYLNSCNEIANLFLKNGKVIYSLIDKDNNLSTVYDNTLDERSYPIVVLIDRNSASASEILAMALKESYGAILVGKNTYGKGKVQQTMNLSDNSMIKYTTATWMSPNNNIIDGIGIKPGIKVDLTEKYLRNPSDENDSQLQRGLKVLIDLNK